jgi:hypothetical protein
MAQQAVSPLVIPSCVVSTQYQLQLTAPRYHAGVAMPCASCQ